MNALRMASRTKALVIFPSIGHSKDLLPLQQSNENETVAAAWLTVTPSVGQSLFPQGDGKVHLSAWSLCTVVSIEERCQGTSTVLSKWLR